MEIIVDRKWKKDAYTIGKMYVNGKEFSDTLEDKDRGLKDSMPIEEIRNKKVYGETAIPTGTYDLMLTYSPKMANKTYGKKYGGKVPEIISVKGYSGVRIHPFNDAKESQGCIAVGKNNIKGKVTQSTLYYYKLMDEYIVPAVNRKEKIIITIR